eukprot:gnl/Trimastix_PCT/2063.p1 GENE.gnl/Trimastix_PCT/2063~~gnl/Trimastix_PCT/2063.p1  ORF type:complete len:317 (-),score=67.93 gnl/Trimastix_PCT/2063:94-1044(-)
MQSNEPISSSPSSSRWILSPQEIQSRESRYASHEHLLSSIAESAKSLAGPTISKFYVGAAIEGHDGTVYLGANLEWECVSIQQTVHAEQCASTNAWLHSNRTPEWEQGPRTLSVTEVPCGHCRQYLINLIPNVEHFRAILPGSVRERKNFSAHLVEGESACASDSPCAFPFPRLLPLFFRPDPVVTEPPKYALLPPADPSDPLLADGLAMLHDSLRLSSFMSSPSAVALRLTNGRILSGACLQNPAFNPSLPPMQCALIHVLSEGHKEAEIAEAVLLEEASPEVSFKNMTREMLAAVAPNASFCHMPIERVEARNN